MQYITIQGNTYPIKFGLSNLKTLMHKYKVKEIAKAGLVMESLTIDDVPEVLQMGLDNAARILSNDPPLTREQIDDACDMDMSLMPKVFEVFANDLNGEEPKAKEDESKKKIQHKGAG